MVLYLETYSARVSDTYTTRRGKTIAIAHFWRFLTERYPEVTSPAQVRPLHLREYIPHIMAHALTVRRGSRSGEKVSSTAHSWLTDLRTFFSDLCTWALEPYSPFRDFAPRLYRLPGTPCLDSASTRHASEHAHASQPPYLTLNARCR